MFQLRDILESVPISGYVNLTGSVDDKVGLLTSYFLSFRRGTGRERAGAASFVISGCAESAF